MKLLALDTETGGLNPDEHSLLEAAFVLWDGKVLKRLQVLWPSDRYYLLTAYAAKMHAENGLFDDLENHKSFGHGWTHPHDELYVSYGVYGCLTEVLRIWIPGNIKDWTLIGKNVYKLDIPILEKRANLPVDFFSHRSIDVGQLFFDGETIPSLNKLMGDKQTHRAMEDCLAYLELFERWSQHQKVDAKLIEHVVKTVGGLYPNNFDNRDAIEIFKAVKGYLNARIK